MGRIWNWDFEDEKRPTPSPPRPQLGVPSDERIRPPRGGGSRERITRVRRRRGGALLAVVAAVIVIVAAVSSSGGHQRSGSAASRAGFGGPRARAHPPTDPENDQVAAVNSVLAFTPFVREGGGSAREIALTFDDGPGPFTPQVLSVLERYRVRATFFAIGRMLRYFGASTVREIEDGDVIGDHTEDHPMLAHLSAHDQHEQLFEQMARIELLGGERPTLFRPPYGSFNATTLRELRALHLLMVLWTVDTGDYEQPGTSAIVERALAGAHPGAIILMHDGGGTRSQTVEALPKIIEGLHARGYHVVTVPRLLEDDPPPAGEPLPTGLAGD